MPRKAASLPADPPQQVPATRSKPVRRTLTGPRARAIAATEPTSPKKRPGRISKPLAPARIAAILDALARTYPDAVCALHHADAWQLTIATILSAQSTDAGVNLVTPELFRQFPTPATLAAADPAVVEELIRRTGFYRTKTRSIIGASKAIVDRFGGNVPQTMDELLTLPGVARKTANVVLGSWFAIATGVVVDTHVLRLSRRLELTANTTPEKVERDLQAILPEDQWIDYSHRIIHHGRQICLARKPRCADCTLEPLCNSADKTWSSH